ncbi:hypothetical protein DPMN_070345 [Dreissena polymorpha]|uniref:Uncharacterized protein n=1 Tax=Dreissena polymorpha TaxID=45954 RepID=A0A9D3Z0T9_DREPO|nr:hypothetical protein DPMN_070345 [Dreissena polymorpha]
MVHGTHWMGMNRGIEVVVGTAGTEIETVVTETSITTDTETEIVTGPLAAAPCWTAVVVTTGETGTVTTTGGSDLIGTALTGTDQTGTALIGTGPAPDKVTETGRCLE